MGDDPVISPKARVRFGLRLNWPIANAGTCVTYLTEDQFVRAQDALVVFKSRLGELNNATLREAAARLFIERS